MFRCDYHHQGAYCASLLKLQCYNSWLTYIVVVNLVVWLHAASPFHAMNNNNNINNNNIYLLQLGCHPVAVVILHVYKI